MPNDVLDHLHPSLRESFIPIEADIALHLPGDVVSAVRDILTPSHSHQDSTFEEAQLHAVKLA